jgi:SNF2 family DNA or RNA helicase
LWVLFFTFGLTKLDYTSFCKRYCEYEIDGYNFKTREPIIKIYGTKEELIPEIHAMLDKIMLRRLKGEVMSLPELKYERPIYVQPCEVNIQHFIHYAVPVEEPHKLKAQLERDQGLIKACLNNVNDISASKELTVLEHLFDSVSTLRKYQGLQKVEGTLELLRRELRAKEYEKIVVFCVHKSVMHELFMALKDEFRCIQIYGGQDPRTKQHNIDKFQNNPQYKIAICNMKAAGVAITMTAASEVLTVERMWTPAMIAQAIMRVHRRGQTKPVRVRDILLKDSIDDVITHKLKRKTKDLTMIFDRNTAITNKE